MGAMVKGPASTHVADARQQSRQRHADFRAGWYCVGRPRGSPSRSIRHKLPRHCAFGGAAELCDGIVERHARADYPWTDEGDLPQCHGVDSEYIEYNKSFIQIGASAFVFDLA